MSVRNRKKKADAPVASPAPTAPSKMKEKKVRKSGIKRLLLYSPLYSYLCSLLTKTGDGFPFWSAALVNILVAVFMAVSNFLWLDNIVLSLFLFCVVLCPALTLLATVAIVVPALEFSVGPVREAKLGQGKAVSTLYNTFEDQLALPVHYPGLIGYYGWNYEAAVGLGALKLDPDQIEGVNSVLKKALDFPNPGYWIKNGLPAFWLYSVGDRIGLFGGLYKGVDETVYNYAYNGTKNWPRVNNVIVRALSWRKFLFGFDTEMKWIWADDVYMAGATLLEENPEDVKTLLLSTREYLLDRPTGLWWHGAVLDLDTKKVAEVNGQKWGRAHAWILLMLARYAETTNELLWLEEELDNTAKYQRESGAFGNLVDDVDSPDETSLTSIFIYAVGVQKHLTKKSPHADKAKAAWIWLNNRAVKGFKMSNTCGAAPLGRTTDDYNKNVRGLQHGPAIAFIVWARMGAQKLSLI